MAALGCGLMAGVFFAFSTFVMKALSRIPQGEGIAWVAHVAGFLVGLGLVRHFLKKRPVRLQRLEQNGLS